MEGSHLNNKEAFKIVNKDIDTYLEIEKVFADAIDVYGEEFQIDMMIEECSELITTLQHYRRGRVLKDKVCEELADVQIMAQQLKMIFGSERCVDWVVYKVGRLKKSVDDKKKSGQDLDFES